MKIPVLVYTDIGRDVDDALAICYMAGNPLIEIVGVVTTHMIPDRRAMIARVLLDSLRLESVPVGVGSIHTLDRDSEVPRYIKNHKVSGATYEGLGLIPCFQSAKKVMIDCIEKYGKSLMVSVQAPLTDLAKITEQLAGVGGLFIQGNALVTFDTNVVIAKVKKGVFVVVENFAPNCCRWHLTSKPQPKRLKDCNLPFNFLGAISVLKFLQFGFAVLVVAKCLIECFTHGLETVL